MSVENNNGVPDNAIGNAMAWLTLLDNADYESCWYTAAEYFKNGVSLEEWIGKGSSARNAVGDIQSRDLASSQETEELVGPDGRCLICEYKSRFATVGEIGERLTLHLEHDGQWRVIGYYLV